MTSIVPGPDAKSRRSQPRKKLWIKLFSIKDSLTLDRVGKVDSNQIAIREHVACRLSEGAGKKPGAVNDARARDEFVCPIRFDQGIGTIDSSTSL